MKILFFGASSEIAISICKGSNIEIYGISRKKVKNTYTKYIIVKNYSNIEIIKKLKKENLKFDHIFFFNGEYSPSLLSNFNKSDFNKILDTNFSLIINSTINLIKHNFLKENGSVCFVSSVAGLVPEVGNAYYSLSKNLLNFGMKILSKEFKRKNFRFNCLSLGFIKTEFSRQILNFYTAKQRKLILNQQKNKFITNLNLLKKFKYICSKKKLNSKIIKLHY